MNTEPERIVLENVTSRLRDEGYQVVLSPDRLQLPTFLQDTAPDAVAFGDKKNLVVEVVGDNASGNRKLAKFREAISSHPDWELYVVGVLSGEASRGIGIVQTETIESANNEIGLISDAGHPIAALLFAWASFEATARALLPNKFLRPQTPGRIVEVLAAEGVITPDEGAQLRKLAEARNQAVHGNLYAAVSADEIRGFTRILQSLVRRLKAQERRQERAH